MSNDYYNHGSVPINRSLAQSALIRTEFDNVAAGFAKLPALTGNVSVLSSNPDAPAEANSNTAPDSVNPATPAEAPAASPASAPATAPADIAPATK